MTLKFNGFKAKRNFHTILNFVLFQKYEMYENKYRTKFVTLQYYYILLLRSFSNPISIAKYKPSTILLCFLFVLLFLIFSLFFFISFTSFSACYAPYFSFTGTKPDKYSFTFSAILSKLIPNTIGNSKKKEIVREVALGDKHHLRKSADRKAQISPVSGTNAFLISAFRSADFLRWCLSPEATSRTISFFSISNSFRY